MVCSTRLDSQTHVEMRGSLQTLQCAQCVCHCYLFLSFVCHVSPVIQSLSDSRSLFSLLRSIRMRPHICFIHMYCLRLCSRIDEHSLTHSYSHTYSMCRGRVFGRVWINLCKHQNYVVEFELSTCSVRKTV